MVSEYETTSETTEPERKSFIPWLILIALIVLVCCCCSIIISGWFLGDMFLENFEQFLGGNYY